MELDERAVGSPKFSIILPLYRQAAHVERIVAEYTPLLDAQLSSYEVLLIPNGPDDGTIETAKRLAQTNSSLRVLPISQGGWGRAVKHGLAQAQGQLLCYTNSARTDIYDLLRILKSAENNPDTVVKATRIMRESILRRIGSTLYNIEFRMLFRVPTWDVNGTPKIIPTSYLSTLDLESDGDGIDAEVVAKVFKNRIPIIEIPTISISRLPGKSTTNFKSAFRMYSGLWTLWNRLKN